MPGQLPFLSAYSRKRNGDYILAYRLGNGKRRAADEAYGRSFICGKDRLARIGTGFRNRQERAGLGDAVDIHDNVGIHLCACGNVDRVGREIGAAAVDRDCSSGDGEIIGTGIRDREGNGCACSDAQGRVGGKHAVYGTMRASARIAGTAVITSVYRAAFIVATFTATASAGITAACAADIRTHFAVVSAVIAAACSTAAAIVVVAVAVVHTSAMAA